MQDVLLSGCPTAALATVAIELLWQEMQVPSASPLLRCGPGSWVLLTGLHADNRQQLPGSARLHTGDGWRRRVEMFPFTPERTPWAAHTSSDSSFPASPPPLPFPFLSVGKNFARYGMSCCGKSHLLALNRLSHQQGMKERTLHLLSRAALFSSLQGLLSGQLVWEGEQGSRNGESLLLLKILSLCPRT